VNPALIGQENSTASTAEALAAVRRLSFAALHLRGAEEVYRELARELFALFGVDQVHVTRVGPDRKGARATRYVPGPAGQPIEAGRYVTEFQTGSAVERVMQTERPYNEPDAGNSPILNQALVERFNVASALFVPVAFEEEVKAVAILVSETARVFADDQVQLVYTLANQAAAALAGVEMRSRLALRAERQTALARAAGALNARLDPRAVLDTLCREADLALGGDIAGVYIGDGEVGGLAVAAHGIDPGSPWFGYRMKPGEGVAGRVLETGRPVVTNAYRDDVSVPASEVLKGVATAVSVPVCWNGELKGALSVGFYSMREVRAEDLETLQAIADLAALAASNAEAFEAAKAAARTDSLTGLLNHGAVQVRLMEEVALARRNGSRLSCLLVDIDNFKPINDVHGHLVGDQILREAAAAIASEFRSYDAIGRFGGDEFLLVLPKAGEEEAMASVERVQHALAAAGQARERLGLTLTMSAGVATWRRPQSASELLERSDRALLLAKARGKNTAVLAGRDTETELARHEATDGGPPALLQELWDLVSECEQPREVLERLPFFLRRGLELEEVALYVPSSGRPGKLERVAHARVPGDPGRAAFGDRRLELAEHRLGELEGGAAAFPSLRQLLTSLGASSETAARHEIAGTYAALAVARDGDTRGLLAMRSRKAVFSPTVLRRAELLAGQAMTAMLGQSQGASRSAVGALAAAIDARDNYTHAHSEEVVRLATESARRLGLSSTEVDRVRDGAMLHDVGKVAIPNEILYKPGPLTLEEWEIMREHPVIGERILRRTPELSAIAPLVRHEHERWDGTGYPDGISGTDIPVGSRIILACDAYSAMITERPYRQPMNELEAAGELRANAGSQFDPDVIETLLDVLGDQGVPGRAGTPSAQR